MRSASPFVALLAFTCACGDVDPSGPLGRFQLTFAPDGLSFSLIHPSGLALTSAARDVVAFRRADATYEMSEGSFLIEETVRSDWVPAARFTDVTRDGDHLTLPLLAADGARLGTLSFDVEGEDLVLRAEAADPNLRRARLQLGCDAASEGGFLGFGAQTWDVDHRGERVPVWVSEQGIGKVPTEAPHPVWNVVGTRHQSYLAVPTLLAPRAGASYGLHATTLHRSIWDLCATDPNTLGVETWERTVEVHVSPGPRPLDVIAQQTAKTGRTPLGPDWTFGVWMESIGGSQVLRDEAARLRAAHIPASAIWSEDFRGATSRSNGEYVLDEDWRWDEALYPALPDVIRDLHALGINFQAYANTFVVEDRDVWSAALAGGHLVQDRRGAPYTFQAPSLEPSGLADLFTEPNRAFVRGELQALLALGIDGWMADFAEWYPADPRTVTPSDGSDPEAAHHRYPVEWAAVNQEAVAASGRTDTVIYHRSGYTGSQKVAHVIWAGDQRTSFQEDDGLPTVIPIITGLGVAGFPIVTHDIGGYISATNPPTTKELFLRWTVLGALNPVMRTHHGRSAAANWRWSSDAETTAVFRRWAELHTRLFPTWKGLARDAAETGAPILRTPALFDPADVALHGVKDAYMIGELFYVAPVVTASTSARDVRLPRGTWYDVATHAAVDGGRTLRVDVPLGEVGLWARAGAIVPMLPAGVESLVANPAVTDVGDVRAEREVDLWLGADGATTDGDGGRYTLSSPARPSGALAAIEGATATISSADAEAVFTAPPNATVTLIDAAGARHVLDTRGLSADLKLRYTARW